MGSDGSAAGGGRIDLSEWQRSARDEGGYAEDIRREPQQDNCGVGCANGLTCKGVAI